MVHLVALELKPSPDIDHAQGAQGIVMAAVKRSIVAAREVDRCRGQEPLLVLPRLQV